MEHAAHNSIHHFMNYSHTQVNMNVYSNAIHLAQGVSRHYLPSVTTPHIISFILLRLLLDEPDLTDYNAMRIDEKRKT